MTIQVPEHLPESIALSDAVHIDFHAGHNNVSWATLYTTRMATEIGSAHSPNDLADVLTMAAAVLMEHPSSATRTFADRSTGERWVLVGSWVLSARLNHEHTQFDSPAMAASHFSRLVGSRL